MSKIKHTRLIATYEPRLDRAPACTSILAFARALDAPLWALIQSYETIGFYEWNAEQLPHDPIGNSFAGRIFAAHGEVRWTCDRDGVRVWTFREDPNHGEPCRVAEKAERYYLWGKYDGRAKLFVEDVVADMRVSYPLHSRPPVDGERPFIWVVEYLPVEPDSVDPVAIVAALNQPRVMAYRFKGFETGMDKNQLGAKEN